MMYLGVETELNLVRLLLQQLRDSVRILYVYGFRSKQKRECQVLLDKYHIYKSLLLSLVSDREAGLS